MDILNQKYSKRLLLPYKSRENQIQPFAANDLVMCPDLFHNGSGKKAPRIGICRIVKLLDSEDGEQRNALIEYRSANKTVNTRVTRHLSSLYLLNKANSKYNNGFKIFDLLHTSTQPIFMIKNPETVTKTDESDNTVPGTSLNPVIPNDSGMTSIGISSSPDNKNNYRLNTTTENKNGINVSPSILAKHGAVHPLPRTGTSNSPSSPVERRTEPRERSARPGPSPLLSQPS